MWSQWTSLGLELASAWASVVKGEDSPFTRGWLCGAGAYEVHPPPASQGWMDTRPSSALPSAVCTLIVPQSQQCHSWPTKIKAPQARKGFIAYGHLEMVLVLWQLKFAPFLYFASFSAQSQ